MATIEKPVSERRHEHLMLDFLAYLEFERGLSRNTLEAYRGDLLQFGRFLQERSTTAVDADTSQLGSLTDLLTADAYIERAIFRQLHPCTRAGIGGHGRSLPHQG